MSKHKRRHLGTQIINGAEHKAYIEDDHLVVYAFGRPRFIKALPLDVVAAHVWDKVKPKKSFPHPEFGFIAPAQ
jgi:hypothetical protein